MMLLKLESCLFICRVVGKAAALPQDDDQSGRSNPYYLQTLIKCTDKLVDALSGSPLTIADQLLAKGFISSEAYVGLLEPSLTAEHKARMMLKHVRSTVHLKPEKYIEFVQVLQNNIALYSTSIVDSLHNAYSTILREIQDKGSLDLSKLMWNLIPGSPPGAFSCVLILAELCGSGVGMRLALLLIVSSNIMVNFVTMNILLLSIQPQLGLG